MPKINAWRRQHEMDCFWSAKALLSQLKQSICTPDRDLSEKTDALRIGSGVAKLWLLQLIMNPVEAFN